MNEPNQYNSYCETITQIPTETFENIKDGIIQFDTIVALAGGILHTARAIGWWRGSTLESGKLLAGPFHLSITDRLILNIEKGCSEVRSGTATGSTYLKTHMEKKPLSIRAFGKVVDVTVSSFEIAHRTRNATQDAKDKTGTLSYVKFVMPENWDPAADPLPQLGSFAGGRGIVVEVETDSHPRLVVNTQHIQQPVFNQKVVAYGTSFHKKYASIYAGEDADTSSTSTAGMKTAQSAITTTSRNTFCEITHRFMIVGSADTNPRVQIVRFLTAENRPCDLAMAWPFDAIPPLHTIFSAHGFIGFQQGQAVLIPTASSIELRPGSPKDPSYRELHVPKGKAQVRVAGYVIKQETRTSTMEAWAYLDGVDLPSCSKMELPNPEQNKRFANTKPFERGLVASVRGSVKTFDPEAALIVIDPESLQNAAPGVPDTTHGVDTPSSSVSPWDSPIKNGKSIANASPATPPPFGRNDTDTGLPTPASSASSSSAANRAAALLESLTSTVPASAPSSHPPSPTPRRGSTSALSSAIPVRRSARHAELDAVERESDPKRAKVSGSMD
ncbi:hypothetical protein OC834_005899 [Tilletia horrida]|nr:hypothetical protein OC834_005899 [Tilletia horrida]KAK0530839.1 hypothetical protein OC835_003881 [Tilletia horrida]KAK0558341.1 hypothetical protein OC844_005234 [Tilletia horrida]